MDSVHPIPHELTTGWPTRPLQGAPDAWPRSLAFTSCLTLSEWLAGLEADPANAPLLRRMSEARIPPDVQLFFTDLAETFFLVAVTGNDLPDVPGIVPIWVTLARACPRGELRFVADDDTNLLEQLLGDDSEINPETLEFPQLLVFDDEWRLQGQWGPRPQAAEALLDGWLARHPDYEALAEAGEAGDEAAAAPLAVLIEALQWEVRVWYNSGMDTTAARELQAFFAALSEEDEVESAG